MSRRDKLAGGAFMLVLLVAMTADSPAFGIWLGFSAAALAAAGVMVYAANRDASAKVHHLPKLRRPRRRMP